MSSHHYIVRKRPTGRCDLVRCPPESTPMVLLEARRAELPIVGVFTRLSEAEAEIDDAEGTCSVCSEGLGRHVCSECQAAVLPAALAVSVAMGGAR